jgi:regulatory subunit for Cdc7p protein kinase
LVNKPRLPLQEASSNIPLPSLKKQKNFNQITNGFQEFKKEGNELTNQGNELKKDATELKSIELNNQESMKKDSLQLKPDLSNHDFKLSLSKTNNNQKSGNKVDNFQNQKHSGGGGGSKSGRLIGEELYVWQQSWRKIMKESTVYFEGIKESNPIQLNEFKKASRNLKSIGCDITPFFDNNVTIIISRRPYNSNKNYPANDIFSNVNHHKIKVWDYDKVFRFLKNLGINVDDNVTSTSLPDHQSASTLTSNKGNLYSLLKDEKIFGSTDRDPNAKRDDLHYLEKNYVYVFDLQQKVRPIAVREWKDETYPMLNLTLDGKCPFIPDSSDNSERKKLRRQQKFDASKEYRELLLQATNNIINNIKEANSMNHCQSQESVTSTDKIDDEVTIIQNSSESNNKQIDHDKEVDSSQDVGDEDDFDYYAFKQPSKLPILTRNSSCVNASNSRQFDVFASGYNGASNSMSFGMDSTLNSNSNLHGGNGLGPMISQVPSKNINNLKRRIIIKKQQELKQQTNSNKKKEEINPGYCENCRVKYDNFNSHIISNRHRNFATDDRNFKDIDDLINTLEESRSLGFLVSNGDCM